MVPSSYQSSNLSSSILNSRSAVISLLYLWVLDQLVCIYSQNSFCRLASIVDSQILDYNYPMQIKILFLLLVLSLFISQLLRYDGHDQRSFGEFKERYKKQYTPYEQIYRKFMFMRNKQLIDKHNARQDKSYTMEVNSFADLSLQEFKESYLGLMGEQNQQEKKGGNFNVEGDLRIDVEIDWVSLGKVTRVKDQKMCQSCWAFCSIAALESSYMIHQGLSSIEFSEQQLVDCSTPYGNKGCRGGELWFTFKYLQEKGVTTEGNYPYVGKDQNCKKTGGSFTMPNYGWDVTCGGLYRALVKGPVAVAVDALNWGFYKQGIFDECGNEVTHGVLVVGVFKEYWLIKNSWGIEWGMKGFMKVKTGNTCSICEYPYYPIM